MRVEEKEYQTDWHPDRVTDSFPKTPDTRFFLFRMPAAVRESVSAAEPERLIDVACGDARDILSLSPLGWEVWGVEPSPLQLREAREAAKKAWQRINLVQGFAEWLPFRDGAFNSLICDSSLDHFASPQRAVQEFARVLSPGGRAVIAFVNYGSVSTRLSRMLYGALRAVWPPARRRHFFWDTPVPYEHTWECTVGNTSALGAPYFDVVDCYGVSLLWAVPGWGRLLSLLPERVRNRMLRALDRLARRLPRLADAVVLVWQPKNSTKGEGSA